MKMWHIAAALIGFIILGILSFFYSLYAKVMWIAGAISALGYGATYLFKFFGKRI